MTFAVHQAESGRQGVDMVRSAMAAGEPYEIVFIDWQMPGLDGIETSKMIRALAGGGSARGNVAALFADVENFTSYCDKHEPEDVVSRLDALFVMFERVAAEHGLEKIKTIGDFSWPRRGSSTKLKIR